MNIEPWRESIRQLDAVDLQRSFGVPVDLFDVARAGQLNPLDVNGVRLERIRHPDALARTGLVSSCAS